MTSPGLDRGRFLLVASAPALFVVLWSTGFIGMKVGVPHAGPLTFLAIRFAICTAVLTAACLLFGVQWPAKRAEIGHAAVVGALLHAGYIGAVGEALMHGLSAGVVALVAGLQPLATAALAGPFLGERVSGFQWLGLALAFFGVAMVVWSKLAIGDATVLGFGFAALSLAAITAGTMYQKRFCGALGLRTGMTVQFATAAVLMLAGALAFEDMVVSWNYELIGALAWLSIVTSLGAFALLFVLLRRGAVARVTSLFYLTPPTTVVMGYFLFGEILGAVALFGMAVAVAGVAMANK